MKTYAHAQSWINTHIYSSFIRKSPKLETTQMSLNRGIVKLTVAQHAVEHYSAMKRSIYLLIHPTAWMNLQKIVMHEQTHSKGYILIPFWKWRNYRNGEKINGRQRVRRRQGQEESRWDCERTPQVVLVGKDRLCSWPHQRQSRQQHCTVVLQDVTIERNRVKKRTWDLSVLFLTTTCELQQSQN